MAQWRFVTFDGKPSAWCAERLSYYLKKINYWQSIEHTIITPYGGKDRFLAQNKDFDNISAKPWMQKGLVVVFDEKGACWNSKKWAQHIPIWTHAPQISFIVGPAYGLDKRWSQMASLTLSLSPLTLNHELAQVLVAEQLYRAWAIEKNWPYHQD